MILLASICPPYVPPCFSARTHLRQDFLHLTVWDGYVGTTLHHTAPHLIHTHTGIRSPFACQPTHSLVATLDCAALHFSSSHITFRFTNILEAWRHQPCGKPCCQEQRRYVTIFIPVSGFLSLHNLYASL